MTQTAFLCLKLGGRHSPFQQGSSEETEMAPLARLEEALINFSGCLYFW